MNAKSLLVFLLFPGIGYCAAVPSNWSLQSSKIKYIAYHSFHDTVGVTQDAKGKGVCDNGNCEFLVAAEIKSFQSGDNNRDLHMIQTVKGAANPLVSVRATVPEASLDGDFFADLVVNLGGVEQTYSRVKFTVSEKTARSFRVEGTIPLELEKHQLQRPSLLGVAIKNTVPVSVEVAWQKQ